MSRDAARAIAALAVAAAGPVAAQGFAIESAVLDTRNAQNLGVTSERGALADVFKAQKAVTFGILRAAGVPLESLPPDVRARIERFQTTNVDAFRAFSLGLDLKDQGRFAEAKEQFRRAAELDPGFGLAVEQQQAMPDVNVGTGVQLRAVIAAASTSAVDRGKQGFVVDLARAQAALQAGQTVSVQTQPATLDKALDANDYTTNPPGSGSNFLPNLVVGVSYGYTDKVAGPLNLAVVGEWTADKYVVGGDGKVLERLGTEAQPYATRGTADAGAPANAAGELTLGDGSKAYWGWWISTDANRTASVSFSGSKVVAPDLGQVDYVIARATTAMPGSGSVTFTPTVLGSMSNLSGTISVDFLQRSVSLNGLGFTIGTQAFSGLLGSASYADPTLKGNSASGFFQGNYSAGSCTGCQAFTPQSSFFGGNFVGKEANGLVFGTVMLTGGAGTASGVQLFTRPTGP